MLFVYGLMLMSSYNFNFCKWCIRYNDINQALYFNIWGLWFKPFVLKNHFFSMSLTLELGMLGLILAMLYYETLNGHIICQCLVLTKASLPQKLKLNSAYGLLQNWLLQRSAAAKYDGQTIDKTKAWYYGGQCNCGKNSKS